MTRIPYGEPGMAGNENEVFTHQQLVTGNGPKTTTAEVVAAATISGADLPAHSVVGRNGSDELVLAVLDEVTPANSIPPIGITTSPVKQGATARNVSVWRDGCFNPDALNWDASYDTDAKKRVAFEAGENQVYIRKPKFSEGV